MKCIICGTKNGNSAKFCQECGQNLAVNYCSNEECQNNKNHLPVGAKYCPLCGSKSDYLLMIERAQAKKNDEEVEKVEEVDEFLAQAIELALDAEQVSAVMLQRRFRIGYARAGRLIDEMERRGIVSGHNNAMPRKVLITREEYETLYSVTPL